MPSSRRRVVSARVGSRAVRRVLSPQRCDDAVVCMSEAEGTHATHTLHCMHAVSHHRAHHGFWEISRNTLRKEITMLNLNP
eukprot:4914762-Pleurochrysis_carterae.AAC.3